MKRFSLLTVVFLASAAPLAAQGPGRAGLSSQPVSVSALNSRERIAVASSGGMTRSERGAVIGAILGIVAGAAISAHYDEKSFSSLASAGIVMAIPASLIGALIGLLM